jgi:hypothetical protein
VIKHSRHRRAQPLEKRRRFVIHVLLSLLGLKDVDGRVKPGHDDDLTFASATTPN